MPCGNGWHEDASAPQPSGGGGGGALPSGHVSWRRGEAEAALRPDEHAPAPPLVAPLVEAAHAYDALVTPKNLGALSPAQLSQLHAAHLRMLQQLQRAEALRLRQMPGTTRSGAGGKTPTRD